MSNMCFRLQQGVQLISALGQIKIMNPFKGPIMPESIGKTSSQAVKMSMNS